MEFDLVSNPKHEDETGSPQGEPVYLAVGKLRRPHGVRGELTMDVQTDFPERLHAGKRIFVGEEHQPYRIQNVRSTHQGLIVHLSGLENPEDAGQLRNQMVYVSVKDLPALPQGEYYFHQIIGLPVVDETGQELGLLAEILETGANDVYIVRNVSGEELLLPDRPEVILEVNLEAKQIRVRPPEWD